MRIDRMIEELQKAKDSGIMHVTIQNNKIYESIGVTDGFSPKLIPGKKLFPLSQEQEMGIKPGPTGKVPGDDMGEFAKYMWDQDKGESGMFKYHNRERDDYDESIHESQKALNVLKEQYNRFK